MKTSLRNLSAFSSSKGVSKLSDTALVPEVAHAISLWVKNAAIDGKVPGVLIGGLALSFYCRPRYTTDADLLFLSDAEKPSVVSGFKRKGNRAFLELQTHVEVETPTPQSINLPHAVAERVLNTAVDHGGLKVASAEALVVMKLYGSDTPHREFKDLADIVEILRNHPDVSLKGWIVSVDHVRKFDLCREKAK